MGNAGSYRSLIAAAFALAVAFAPAFAADAPDVAHEGKPAAGSGPLLVLLTGQDGAPNHVAPARAFAREGFVVVVVDSSRIYSDPGAVIGAGLQRWLARSDVKSPKASVVGYSLGGWIALSFANRMPGQVSAVVAFYPSTFRIADVGPWLASPAVTVPKLVFAGTKDTYMNCCTIERAREIATAADRARAPVELVEVPDANHGFMLAAYPSYRPADAEAAFARALEHLRRHGGAAN